MEGLIIDFSIGFVKMLVNAWVSGFKDLALEW